MTDYYEYGKALTEDQKLELEWENYYNVQEEEYDHGESMIDVIYPKFH